jgi:hypothetical protein
VPDTPLFSRPQTVSVWGKCDSEMEVAMPGPLKDILSRLASFDGKPATTYVREVLESHALLERERVIRIVEATGGDVSTVKTR